MPRNGSGSYSPPTNSFNPAINGVPATASDWQAVLNDIVSAMTQSVSRDGQTAMTGNLPMAGNKVTGLGNATATGDALTFAQLFSQGQQQDVPAAATTDIGAQLSTLINVTGAATITSFGTNYNGPRFLRFAGVCTLANSATLVLPGGANITTAAGDSAIAVPLGNPATGWRVVAYQSDGFVVANNRIRGDFSNATLANRVMFQTSTVNGQTSVGVLPNGTSTSTNLNLFGGTDPANASIAQIVNTGSEVSFRNSLTGTGTAVPMTFYTGGSERMRIDTSGNVLVTGGTGGLGYGTGAGGTVTQATSKSTSVTLNRPCGQITMNNAALGAGASVEFTVNNTLCRAADTVLVSKTWDAIPNANYRVECPGAGVSAFAIRVTNITAGPLSEAVAINFAIIKGAVS